MSSLPEGRESFATRYRRTIALTLWLGSVAGIIALYYATIPKPVYSTAEAAAAVEALPTMQVGALPVT